MNLFDFSFAIFGVVSGSIPWRLFCKKKVFGLFDVFDVYSPIFSSFDLYCYTISCNFSCNKYVRRACEPRICIVWTSSSSSSSLHVAIFVSQVVLVLSHVEVQFFFRLNTSPKAPQLSQHGWPLGFFLSGSGICGAYHVEYRETSSGASVLIAEEITRGTPSVLWIAPRRMAGLMSNAGWIFVCEMLTHRCHARRQG